MQPTQTGIAVALALAVVGVFFVFPGLSPFGQPASAPTTDTTQLASTTTNTTTTNPTGPVPVQPVSLAEALQRKPVDFHGRPVTDKLTASPPAKAGVSPANKAKPKVDTAGLRDLLEQSLSSEEEKGDLSVE